MFGSSSSSSGSFLGGGESGSSGGSILPTFSDEPACAAFCPKLTYQQRLIGFVACACVGWLLSILGTLTLIGGPTTNNIRTFVILYVIGNIIALCATGFLLGPKSQCIKMWHPCRRFTTAFYLSMLIVVLAVAVTKQNIVLIFFLLFVEILAAVWYGLSYIPYGRSIVLAGLRKSGICMPCFFVSDQIKEGMAKNSGSSSTSSSILGGGKK